MPFVRAILTGPTRAITVLSITQIIGWGVLYYPPALAGPLISAEYGWPFALVMGGFSIGLGISGLGSPFACGKIDTLGGNVVMSAGALIGALGLAGIALAPNPAVYLLAWVLIGCAMASILYEPAFATLTYNYGSAARQPITIITFAGGLASTVFWPLTQLLIDSIGWRGAHLVFAGLLAFVVAPLHAFALPRERAQPQAAPPTAVTPVEKVYLPPRGWPFILIAAGFAVHAFVMSGVAAHLLGMLQRAGISATEAVIVGALIGPAQVVSRFMDFATRGRAHPVWIARGAMVLMTFSFALLLISGMSFSAAVLFAILYGAANGVMTIARGALTLVLFGPTGYGRVLGRIARPVQILQAAAPFAIAFLIEASSDNAMLALSAFATAIALVCFTALRRPA